MESKARNGCGFGCALCLRASAEETWQARSRLTQVARLIDESHFTVVVLKCPACGQEFLSVFTESIDWVNSEDPQHWAVVPITLDELEWLTEIQPVDLEWVQTIGEGRRCLHFDHPSSGPPVTYWTTGPIRIGPHD